MLRRRRAVEIIMSSATVPAALRSGSSKSIRCEVSTDVPAAGAWNTGASVSNAAYVTAKTVSLAGRLPWWSLYSRCSV